jgi:sensor c-di-GMP phosphodiesterase-like protein
MTTYASIPETLRVRQRELVAFILIGGLCGAVVGLLISVFYIRREGIEQKLRRAIAKDALRVVYQPIVDLSSRRIIGAEALARWTDEDELVVDPDVFIKIAEQRGFVGAITKLVVKHVLHDFAETLRSSPDFHISVNIAAADLSDPTFVPMLEESLAQAGVKPQGVAIEITESYTARRQVAMDAILRLRRSSLSVHIDDFGTGYSSLSYLQDLSVDAIKIDRSFTRAIGTEAVTVAILPQILAMAEALKLQVIVEGIETREQAGYFSALSQPILAQGWLFGRPVAAEELRRLLTENWILSANTMQA